MHALISAACTSSPDPQAPQARLAAWAVTQAVGDHGSHEFLPVAHGGLPGQWQTILRAEIQAAITATCLARQHDGAARIWCDNALVVRRFRQIQPIFFYTKA